MQAFIKAFISIYTKALSLFFFFISIHEIHIYILRFEFRPTLPRTLLPIVCVDTSLNCWRYFTFVTYPYLQTDKRIENTWFNGSMVQCGSI